MYITIFIRSDGTIKFHKDEIDYVGNMAEPTVLWHDYTDSNYVVVF